LAALQASLINEPPAIQKNVIDDALFDVFLLEEAKLNIQSSEDGLRAVKAFLQSQLQWTAALEAGPLVQSMWNKYFVWKAGTGINPTSKLAKALSRLALGVRTRLPIIVVSRREAEAPELTVQVPLIPEDNQGQLDNLGHFLKFATRILGINADRVKLAPNANLGNSCLLPAFLANVMTSLIGAFDHSLGLFAGEEYSFPSGFKGNLAEILGAIRILRLNQDVVRKRPQPTGKNSPRVHTTSLGDLQDLFNEKFGLKRSDLQPWAVSFLKAILSESTKSNQSFFPGGIIHAARVRNTVRTSDGILAKLGYVPVVPQDQKLREVLLTRIIEKEEKAKEGSSSKPQTSSNPSKGKEEETNRYLALVSDSEWKEQGCSFTELRTAVVLSLAKYNPKVDKSPKEQIEVESLASITKSTRSYYKEHAEVVDALNYAYAVKVSLKDKRSKSKPSHFLEARNRLINATANKPFVDALGIRYSRFQDTPDQIRGYLEKKYHSKKNDAKRSAEDSMQVDNAPKEEAPMSAPPQENPEPSLKKVKGSSPKSKTK
jgi:hypothetical protein